eukprot:364815-Chlamydomonas_euryale.AAC.10
MRRKRGEAPAEPPAQPAAEPLPVALFSDAAASRCARLKAGLMVPGASPQQAAGSFDGESLLTPPCACCSLISMFASSRPQPEQGRSVASNAGGVAIQHGSMYVCPGVASC